MRRGRIITWVTAIAAAALTAAPAAFGDPGELAKDLADGRVDGTYSQADWDAYSKNAMVQGYGNPVTPPPVTPPLVTPPPVTPPAATPPPAAAVAGAQSPQQTPAQQSPAAPAAQQPQSQPSAGVAGAQSPPLAATQQVGTLPFTGIDLALLVLGGALLLGLGLGARRLGRN